MTRCFGSQLPASYLCPMADFMNHSKRGITYFIVNKKFEENKNKKPSEYNIKKSSIDLRILDGIQYESINELKDIFYCENGLVDYLENYQTKLKNPINISDARFLEKEDLIDNVR